MNDDDMHHHLIPCDTVRHDVIRPTLAHVGTGTGAAVTRSLHLVDIENLVGARHLTVDVATATAVQYRAIARLVPGDLCVVAASHHNGYVARMAFPAATARWRSGRDGADLALLEALDEFNLDRFGRLVIGSGDGIFAETATVCRSRGLAVSVVGRPDSMAARLTDVVIDVARTANTGTGRSGKAA